MTVSEFKRAVADGAYDGRFRILYGTDCDMAAIHARYAALADGFITTFGDQADTVDVSAFSVAGRSEVSGNHTDHNHGCVLAASINLDIIALAYRTDDGCITVKSEGFPQDRVALADVATVRQDESGKASALIRGVCDGFVRDGLMVGGFAAYTSSNVLKGSGLSSSAAFEDMIGNILNQFYNGGAVSTQHIAKIAQYAENVHFGKPCGLMDQMACAVGGFIYVDFCDPKAPTVEKLPFDLGAGGYKLCIVNTGGNHADLTPDYAAVPAEMKAVAGHFGKAVLRQVELSDIMNNIPKLREAYGDRAVMRALHFLDENARVRRQAESLKNGDLQAFLADVRASGASSVAKLQNVFTTKNVREQGISLALAIASAVLDDKPEPCAYRVHGGGFAGTVQCFVPEAYVEELGRSMKRVFGNDCFYVLSVRPYGAVCLEAMDDR